MWLEFNLRFCDLSDLKKKPPVVLIQDGLKLNNKGKSAKLPGSILWSLRAGAIFKIFWVFFFCLCAVIFRAEGRERNRDEK